MTLKLKKQNKQLHIGLLIPTYNEEGNIGELLHKLAAVAKTLDVAAFNVLVIDDSSPDATQKEVKQAAKKLNCQNININLLVRKNKEGLGKAYIEGIMHYLNGYPALTHILQMDADLSHDPKHIKDFIVHLGNGSDMVVASRYVKGGGVHNWGIHRKIMSRWGNYYIQCFLGRKITDYTGGYNAYSVDILKKINFSETFASGYGFLIELKFNALKHASDPIQVPLIFSDRANGVSKIPRSTIVKTLLLAPKLRLVDAQEALSFKKASEF